MTSLSSATHIGLEYEAAHVASSRYDPSHLALNYLSSGYMDDKHTRCWSKLASHHGIGESRDPEINPMD